MRRIILLSAAIAAADGFAYERRVYNRASFDAQLADLHRVGLEFEIISYVGHPVTAKFMSQKTGLTVEYNRGTWEPRDGDVAIVATVKPGHRLPPMTEITDMAILEEHMTLSTLSVLSFDAYEYI